MNKKKMTSFSLTKLIKGTWCNGGWIRKFEKYQNAYKFAEMYHEKYLEEMKASEKFYYEKELPRVWDEIEKWKKENPGLVEEFKNNVKKEREVEFKKTKKELEAELYSNISVEKKEEKFKELEKIDNKMKARIDDDMIRSARNYPIDRLLTIKNNFALCLWHRDKNPSMYCKNNYVHCFSCGKTGDSIDVYMQLNNCSFVEAVIDLNN